MGELSLESTEYYMNLPFDVSGSLSKNRFRLELLWGIDKMFELYDYGDFTVVFDYVCDIEVHLKNKYEFYQIKTHRGSRIYTVNDIIKQKNGKSILGKLYILKHPKDFQSIKLAIVSNSYLKDGNKVISDLEEVDLTSISQVSINKIKAALKTECKIDDIDISDMYYIFTSMNLNEPTNDIIGKIVTSFVKIKGCEPKKPNALYRLIYDVVLEKACCELTQNNYSQVIDNKGLTRSNWNKITNNLIGFWQQNIKQPSDLITPLVVSTKTLFSGPSSMATT